MLKVALLDANQRSNKDEQFIDAVVSHVGHWLKWECEQAAVPLHPPGEADVIFLIHAGMVDWSGSVKRALKRYKISHDPDKRGRKPYIIAGGAVDPAPFTALSVADALAVGEAYLFVRQVLDLIKAGGDVDALAHFVYSYPHALERTQLTPLQRDPAKPWQLVDIPDILATPDEWVDWDANPAIRSEDKVVRILAAKGCHLKCKFCATTYRQTYKVNPNEGFILGMMSGLSARKERVSLITNDAAALPYFEHIPGHGQLDSQSMTIKALRNPAVVDAVIASRVKIARFGVEGVSERLRQGYGKPVTNEELINILGRLSDAHIHTHMFYIVGAPYEDDSDYENFKLLYRELCRRVDWGIIRLKFTAFNAQPPTPLAYFLTDPLYYERMDHFHHWVAFNWASRHFVIIPPRKQATRLEDLADSFNLPVEALAGLFIPGQTIDLAPTLDDAHRMTWEVIGWPLDVERRWRLSRSYMKYMGALDKN